MDSKQFRRRVWVMVLALSLTFGSLGTALYDLQINHGEEYYARAHTRMAETQTVESVRGQLLDRNGQVLVSNRVVYQVSLDSSLMGDARNEILLSLIQIARESQVEWTDTLPITTEEPFTFTTDTPYYTLSTKEDGTQTRTLTRLGRLAVHMKWIEDPTKDPVPVAAPTQAEEPAEPGLWEKLMSFLTGTEPAPPEDTQREPVQPARKPLPTAKELLGIICTHFDIKGEGAAPPMDPAAPSLNIGIMDSADARALAGVLFELTYREKISNWPPYVFAEGVDIDFISRVKEHSLTGVIIEPTTVRQYHTTYAAHLLGRVAAMNAAEVEYYTNLDADGDGSPDYNQNDMVGKEGAELAFESWLRGTPGLRTVERNANGKIVSETWIKEPEPGDNVILTLDIGLQAQVENTLATSLPNLVSQEVEGAACVVLDVNNADILAAASYPTYDLASYGADYAENAANSLKPLYNRAFQGTYAPGSTFKMVTALAGLEENIITPNTKIRDEGRYTYYANSVAPQCWIYRQQGRTHGLQTVSEAITNSCNYFFFDVGRQLGISRLSDYAARFGLGQKTGVELTENAGVMAGPEYTKSMGGTWYDGSTLSVAIGQESSQFTPIQLANYIATLVNGGTRNATHLLKEVKSNDFSQILYTYDAEPLSTIEIKDKNLNAVKAGMLELTTTGSVARHFQQLPVQAGAKTGSAQVSTNTESNAVFVCFAPYDDPEIAVAMVVEHGGSGSELGAMAADILSYYFSSQESRADVLPENQLVR